MDLNIVNRTLSRLVTQFNLDAAGYGDYVFTVTAKIFPKSAQVRLRCAKLRKDRLIEVYDDSKLAMWMTYAFLDMMSGVTGLTNRVVKSTVRWNAE